MQEAVERCSAMLEYMARGILRDEEAVEDCLARVSASRRGSGRRTTTPGAGPSRPGWPSCAGARRSTCCGSAAGTALSPRRPWANELADSAPGPEEELLRAERARRLRAALRQAAARPTVGCSTGNLTISQSTAQLAAELGTTERAVEGRLYPHQEEAARPVGR